MVEVVEDPYFFLSWVVVVGFVIVAQRWSRRVVVEVQRVRRFYDGDCCCPCCSYYSCRPC